jgi:hypothetical protein
MDAMYRQLSWAREESRAELAAAQRAIAQVGLARRTSALFK